MEIVLNLYVVIESDLIKEFRAKAYNRSGSDDEKISFLKSCAESDFEIAERFDVPMNKSGQFMSYKKFAKLERQGKQFHFFEDIFEKYNVPPKPLVCVTPVLDGKILI